MSNAKALVDRYMRERGYSRPLPSSGVAYPAGEGGRIPEDLNGFPVIYRLCGNESGYEYLGFGAGELSPDRKTTDFIRDTLDKAQGDRPGKWELVKKDVDHSISVYLPPQHSTTTKIIGRERKTWTGEIIYFHNSGDRVVFDPVAVAAVDSPATFVTDYLRNRRPHGVWTRTTPINDIHPGVIGLFPQTVGPKQGYITQGPDLPFYDQKMFTDIIKKQNETFKHMAGHSAREAIVLHNERERKEIARQIRRGPPKPWPEP